MNPKVDHYVTPEEYDLLQPSYDCRTEYCNGEIVMVSHTSTYHNEVVGNIHLKMVNIQYQMFLKMMMNI